MKHEEHQYLKIMREILEDGTDRQDRTGVGSRALWGATMRFDLSRGFPLFTTRFISARIAIEEMLFFLRGEADTKKLEAKDIHIWHGNTTREFLDARGLRHLPEGHMGKGYGWQIRNFGGYDEQPGFDQLAYLVENIRKNPNDRRHLMSYWNPQQVLDQAALPPCHMFCQFQVLDGKLNSMWFQRSCDFYHGVPNNTAGYAFLTYLLAELTGYEPGTLVFMGSDVHLYQSQFEVAQEQLQREPKPFPQFKFSRKFESLDDALEMSFDDVQITGYEHCGRLRKVEMAV